MKRSLTGIRPSGNPHLGNFLGSIRPAIERQSDFHCMYFIADMHSLTSLKDPTALKSFTYDLVATWLALGFKPGHNIMYRQSDIPEVTELSWYLSCCTGMGLLEKSHAYKDALTANRDVNHGVFAYPVLMAADILLYEPDIVPVGKDQKQHVEMARDMAGSFNSAFKCAVLKLPEPVIDETVMSIPGLDGRKMSKSYGNEIPVFCSQAELKKLVMSIKTDSLALEAPKQLEGSLIAELFKHFASSEKYADLDNRLAAGGLGWGHAKIELFEAIDNFLSKPRELYNQIRPDITALDAILDDGAKQAREIANKVLNNVRKEVGFKPRTI